MFHDGRSICYMEWDAFHACLLRLLANRYSDGVGQYNFSRVCEHLGGRAVSIATRR